MSPAPFAGVSRSNGKYLPGELLDIVAAHARVSGESQPNRKRSFLADTQGLTEMLTNDCSERASSTQLASFANKKLISRL